MDSSSEILDYLSESPTPRVVLLAPNAPPVSRLDGKVEVALNTILSDSNIEDTLRGLRVHALGAEERLPPSGSFSFGIHNVGRIRVNYATQRGSRIVSIANVPFTIPKPDEFISNSATADRVLQILQGEAMGLLAVTGPSTVDNSRLIYSLLAAVSERVRRIIYIVERHLTFLLRHSESIVVQTEHGADVEALDEGVQNAFMFDPDMLYVSDVRANEYLPGVRHAVASGVLTIVNSASLDAGEMLDVYAPPRPGSTPGPELFRGRLSVLRNAEGKLDVAFKVGTPGER